MRSIKTRSVLFSYGLVKDALLEIPAEAYSLHDVACLIRRSYLAWRFDGHSIMSDEVVVSSLGQAHFFAGALGGYETRLDAKTFASLKDCANSAIALAVDVVKLRAGKQGKTLTDAEVYTQASRNEALNATERDMLASLAKHAA